LESVKKENIMNFKKMMIVAALGIAAIPPMSALGENEIKLQSTTDSGLLAIDVDEKKNAIELPKNADFEFLRLDYLWDFGSSQISIREKITGNIYKITFLNKRRQREQHPSSTGQVIEINSKLASGVITPESALEKQFVSILTKLLISTGSEKDRQNIACAIECLKDRKLSWDEVSSRQ